jgi:hypothetical protein
MLCLSLVAAGRSAAAAPLPAGAAWWCRPLVFALYLAQPVIRSWCRYAHRFANLRPRRPPRGARGRPDAARAHVKPVSWRAFDLYWTSSDGRGREDLLEATADVLRRERWRGDVEAEWAPHDVELWPSAWHVARLRTATEELGKSPAVHPRPDLAARDPGDAVGRGGVRRLPARRAGARRGVGTPAGGGPGRRAHGRRAVRPYAVAAGRLGAVGRGGPE